jgi:hypothetical protein
MPPIGATPQNQLDALPIQTATQAAAPDQLVVVGSTLTKYFGPTTLGINGVNFGADPDDAGGSMLLSNYIDLTGCSSFVALMIRTVGQILGDEGGVACTLIPQMRATGPAGIQPRTGNQGVVTWSQVGQRIPSVTAGVYPQDTIMSFPWSNHASGALNPVTIGYDCRLWFRRTIGPKNFQNYACHLWGQS